MAMKPMHFSALSLAITGVGAIVAIWYYRSQAAASDTAQAAQQPYFQSAALPVYSSDGSGGSTAGQSASAGLPSSGASTSTPAATTPDALGGLSASDIDSIVAGSYYTQQQQQLLSADTTQKANQLAAQLAGSNTNINTAGALFSSILGTLPTAVLGSANNFSLLFTETPGDTPGSQNISLGGYTQNSFATPMLNTAQGSIVDPWAVGLSVASEDPFGNIFPGGPVVPQAIQNIVSPPPQAPPPVVTPTPAAASVVSNPVMPAYQQPVDTSGYASGVPSFFAGLTPLLTSLGTASNPGSPAPANGAVQDSLDYNAVNYFGGSGSAGGAGG